MQSKILLIVLDGLTDRGKKTPLSSAKHPNLDKLAAEGITGQFFSIDRGVKPGSDTAHLSILGYDPKKYYEGRGVYETMGAGLELKHGDVCFRANAATVDDKWNILDRRAGRDDYRLSELFGLIDRMKVNDVFDTTHGKKFDDVEIIARHTTEHRGVIILRGKYLSHHITNTDPHTQTEVQRSHALNKTDESHRTASVLNYLTRRIYEIFSKSPANQDRIRKGKKPANMLLLRGAGMYEETIPFSRKFGLSAACIAGGALYKGVARDIGMDILEVPGADATVNTNLAGKAKAAIGALKTHDFVFVHIKAADSCGHDGDFAKKKKFIERIDREFFSKIKGVEAIKVVVSDHSTPVSVMGHTADPTAILIHGEPVRPDSVRKFDEFAVMLGGLGLVAGRELMPMLLDLINKSKMYGE
jgi:2,3-bisphosphoglycerate-independent phosphoglycerate mutase